MNSSGRVAVPRLPRPEDAPTLWIDTDGNTWWLDWTDNVRGRPIPGVQIARLVRREVTWEGPAA